MSETSITKSKEFIECLPEDILVDPENNGKWQHKLRQHNKQAIEDRCKSFELVGQLEPVGVRKVPGENPEDEQRFKLGFGFLRHRAAELYNKKHPDNPMKLKCQIMDVTEEEAFIQNIDENIQRENMTPMDLAASFEKLRSEYKFKDTEIAEHWGYSNAHISHLKALMKLAPEAQEKVHAGEMSIENAMDLAELDEKGQKKALQDAEEEVEKTMAEDEPEEGGKKKKKSKRKALNKALNEAARKGREDSDAPIPMKLAAFKIWLDGMTGESEPEGLKKVVTYLQKVLEGRKTITYERKLRELFGLNDTNGELPKKRSKETAGV